MGEVETAGMNAHRLNSYKEDGRSVPYCEVCAAEDHELPTECPCVVMSAEQRKAVALGELDYWNGQWVMLP